jgi:hypothetical protein
MMTLGGSDSDSYIGNLTSHDLVTSQNQWWTVNYGGTKYGGSTLSHSKVPYAIIDTGTSFMYLP